MQLRKSSVQLLNYVQKAGAWAQSDQGWYWLSRDKIMRDLSAFFRSERSLRAAITELKQAQLLDVKKQDKRHYFKPLKANSRNANTPQTSNEDDPKRKEQLERIIVDLFEELQRLNRRIDKVERIINRFDEGKHSVSSHELDERLVLPAGDTPVSRHSKPASLCAKNSSVSAARLTSFASEAHASLARKPASFSNEKGFKTGKNVASFCASFPATFLQHSLYIDNLDIDNRGDKRARGLPKKSASHSSPSPFQKSSHHELQQQALKQALLADGIDEALIQDWITVREQRRSPLSASAWTLFKAEHQKLQQAGYRMSLSDLLLWCTGRGFASVDSQWQSVREAFKNSRPAEPGITYDPNRVVNNPEVPYNPEVEAWFNSVNI